MRIALVYNEPLPSRYDALGEGGAVAGVMDEVRAVRAALLSLGHTVELVGFQPPLPGALATLGAASSDMVFNLFEGFDGCPETEAQVAAALRLQGRLFTGASSETLALCLDKGKAKEVLEARGLPTPAWRVVRAENVGDCPARFPLIVKPLTEDGSHGLGPESVVWSAEALALRVQWVADRYGEPVLVERFLSGREFNVSVLGGSAPRVLPPTEILYGENVSEPRILTYAAKWLPGDEAYHSTTVQCPARLSPDLQEAISRLALAAHRAVGAPPYVRLDLRCDEAGHPSILEVNPNPDISPDAGMALQARAAGMEYPDLIRTILALALEGVSVG